MGHQGPALDAARAVLYRLYLLLREPNPEPEYRTAASAADQGRLRLTWLDAGALFSYPHHLSLLCNLYQRLSAGPAVLNAPLYVINCQRAPEPGVLLRGKA